MVKTAQGIIIGLNQKFKREKKKDPNINYTVTELEILFDEKVKELNLLTKENPIITTTRKRVGNICLHCGQRIKSSFKVSLSRNNIKILMIISELIGHKGHVETKDIYTKIEKGSATAELTRLKYLGAICPFYTSQDFEKESQRSGKWMMTVRGEKFLKRERQLPGHVIVKNEQVTEVGEGKFIDDDSLEWMKEEDIWKDMKKHWENDEQAGS